MLKLCAVFGRTLIRSNTPVSPTSATCPSKARSSFKKETAPTSANSSLWTSYSYQSWLELSPYVLGRQRCVQARRLITTYQNFGPSSKSRVLNSYQYTLVLSAKV